MDRDHRISAEVRTIVDRCRFEANRQKVEKAISFACRKLEPPGWTRLDVAEVDRRAREALGLIEVAR